jgi:hypothetical protein
MFPTPCKNRLFHTGVAIALFAIGTSAHAATLVLDSVERVSAVVTTPVDLTAQGGLDWAYWSPNTGNLLTSPVAPTNEKLGGLVIGNLDVIGGGSLRGSATATTVERYSFSDGTSPLTGTNASLAGLIFNSQLGSAANGKGLQLSIAGDPGVERIVKLYLGGFGATANLTLTLNGVAVPLTDSSQVFTSTSPKHIAIYTVRFQPDSASDQLLVQYTASNVTDTTNGHVGLQAVTVSAVPEPGVASLACLGALALYRRRRRS